MWKFEGDWHLHRGDCIPHLHEMGPESMHLAVFSPPFPSVYAYSSSEADMGNSEDLRGEVKLHFSFFLRGLRRVMKPGRVVAVHCQDIVRMKRSGGRGLFGFKDLLVRLGERAGFIHDYTWAIRKAPQAQAIRTKSWSLKFAGLESDRAQSRGAIPDYLIKFLTPGDNAVPVNSEGEVSRNDWIKWAEYQWDDIRETDTLNGMAGLREARGEEDTKHICPLQLGLIDRVVRMFSNPGEAVLSPFAGIGSELYTALKLGRRAYGCELKSEYADACEANCRRAVAARQEQSLDLIAMMEAQSS